MISHSLKYPAYVLMALATWVMTPCLCAQEKFEVSPSAPSDGEIAGTRAWDDLPDSVESLEKIVKVGSYFGQEFVGIFEFPLPPSDALAGDPVSIQLVLYAHEKGIINSNIEIFAYFGSDADGVVELSDWHAGQSLGHILVAGESEISIHNQLPAFDVTDVVHEALAAGARYIGFRLRCPEAEVGENPRHSRGIILRPTEFADDFEQYRPKLVFKFSK